MDPEEDFVMESEEDNVDSNVLYWQRPEYFDGVFEMVEDQWRIVVAEICRDAQKELREDIENIVKRLPWDNWQLKSFCDIGSQWHECYASAIHNFDDKCEPECDVELKLIILEAFGSSDLNADLDPQDPQFEGPAAGFIHDQLFTPWYENHYGYKQHPIIIKARRKFVQKVLLTFVIALRKMYKKYNPMVKSYDYAQLRDFFGLYRFQFDNYLIKEWLLDLDLVNEDSKPTKKLFRLPLICWFNPENIQFESNKNDERKALFQIQFNNFKEMFEKFSQSKNTADNAALHDAELQDLFRARASVAWFEIIYAFSVEVQEMSFRRACQKHGIWCKFQYKKDLVENNEEPETPGNYTYIFASNMSNPYLITD